MKKTFLFCFLVLGFRLTGSAQMYYQRDASGTALLPNSIVLPVSIITPTAIKSDDPAPRVEGSAFSGYQLTLYLIEQNKQLQELKKGSEELRQENAAIRELLKKMR